MDEHNESDATASPETEPMPGVTPAAQDAAGPPTAPEGATRADAGVKRRGRARVWLLGALALLIIAGLATGAFLVLQQSNRVKAAQARLDAAVALLDEAEDGLLLVDTAVQAEISPEIATQAAEALPVAASVRADALAAAAILEEIMPDLGEQMLPMAKALTDSANARSEMMTEAPVILEADQKAARAMVPADTALEEIKAAEDLIGKAVTEFNKHTKAGVEQSTANTKQAATHLETARSLFATATAEFAEADYSAFVAYVDAKLALVKDSQEIDALWLAGKVEESNAKLDAYNKKDAEIVEMASKLPVSVRDPIADAYERITAEARERYFEARDRARKAGEVVNALRSTATDGE